MEVTEIILVMTEAMIEAEAISDIALMMRIEEDTLHLEANPEFIKLQEGHMEDQINTEIEVTADKQGSKPNPDPLPEDLELHQGLPAEMMIDVFNCRHFGHFAKDCPEKDTA